MNFGNRPLPPGIVQSDDAFVRVDFPIRDSLGKKAY